MDEYSLDQKAIQEMSQDLQGICHAMVRSDSALRSQVKTLVSLVQEAMQFTEATDTIWKDDADRFLKSLKQIELNQSNARFNRGNGHVIPMPSAGPLPREIGALTVPQDKYQAAALDQKLNAMESEFGEEMDEEALARHFGEAVPVNKDRLKKPINKMNLDEIKEWESEQDNATDIYKISARIMNQARGESGKSLGQQQTMLCNVFCHVVKSFYDFADTIPDKELRKRLITLTRSQEGVPANIIAAAVASVKAPEKK